MIPRPPHRRFSSTRARSLLGATHRGTFTQYDRITTKLPRALGRLQW
jgi:hypothetical protein